MMGGASRTLKYRVDVVRSLVEITQYSADTFAASCSKKHMYALRVLPDEQTSNSILQVHVHAALQVGL